MAPQAAEQSTRSPTPCRQPLGRDPVGGLWTRRRDVAAGCDAAAAAHVAWPRSGRGLPRPAVRPCRVHGREVASMSTGGLATPVSVAVWLRSGSRPPTRSTPPVSVGWPRSGRCWPTPTAPGSRTLTRSAPPVSVSRLAAIRQVLATGSRPCGSDLPSNRRRPPLSPTRQSLAPPITRQSFFVRRVSAPLREPDTTFRLAIGSRTPLLTQKRAFRDIGVFGADFARRGA